MPGKFRRDWPQPSKKWSSSGRKRSAKSKQIPIEPVPELKEQHCLRCHQTFYDDGSAASRAGCIIPHVYKEEPIYLMGGNFTYESDCCGESFTVTEHGAGTGYFEMSGGSAEPCFSGLHTIYASDVKVNEVNVFKCIKDSSGQCIKAALSQTGDEPIFLDWGSSSSSSGSDEGHFLESVGETMQSVQRVRYSRKY